MRNQILTLALTAVAIISAIINIRAEYTGAKFYVYIFKPLTVVIIILIALLKPHTASSFYRYMIIAGLLFSLAGDIFLMLPQDRFIAGLISFLLAHLFYIAAFTSGSQAAPAPLYALPLLLYGGVMLWILFPHLGKMKLPVLVYVLVILIMDWQAFARWFAIRHAESFYAFIGAFLFLASDSVLALNRFRSPFRSAQLLILSTYFAAQWLIAMSV
jgi:uncharacterized membrane protein YhhN